MYFVVFESAAQLSVARCKKVQYKQMGMHSQQLAELKIIKDKIEKALRSATRNNAELSSREGALKSAIRERGAWMATALRTASPSLPGPVACTVLEAETEIAKLFSKLEVSSSIPQQTGQPAPSSSPCGDTNDPSALTPFQQIRGRITPDVVETVKGWTWQDFNNRATLFVR